MKNAKGQYGYLNSKKKKVILYTIFLFALALSIFLMGYLSTGTKKNLLSVVAILGCLPASRSLVNAIMLCRAKGCTEVVHLEISKHLKTLTQIYDLYFTTYKANYPICHLVMKGNVVCAYTEYPISVEACEKHLSDSFLQDGYKNLTVKIFQDLQKYLDRIDQLETLDVEPNKNQEGMIDMLYSITL